MNTAYPLIPVSVIIITAYFFTWLFSKWGMFPPKNHRKFWNYILLITFLISGVLGLISVIKINYKLEIPKYDLFLKWHVSFGIGMVIVSFFHFFQHFKFYFSWSKKSRSEPAMPIFSEAERAMLEKFRYLLFFLGAITMINQVIFIREFMSVLAGNELVLGIVMAIWMILTGWGAFTGRKRIPAAFNLKRGIIMLAFVAFLPVVMIGLLYWLKSLLFPPGTIAGLGSTITGAFLFLSPVCFLSGYLFTAFSTLFSEGRGKNLIGKAYAFESFGSLVGGVLFSLLLGRFFNSYQVVGLTTALVLISGAWLSGWTQKKRMVLYLTAGLLLPVIIFITRPDSRIKKLLFPNQQIVLNRSTRYGNLIVTEQAGQFNFYENNVLQFYTENMMVNEEAVHYAMARHEKPKNILLISGGIAGMINEINKYDVENITYLETNPEVFLHWDQLAFDKGNFENVEIIKLDIRAFMQRTKTVYDVILINLPPPSTLGYNRFFTVEFFNIVKRHCDSKSIVCTSLPSTANYAEENALEVHSSLWKTMGIHFKNLLFVPGEKNYFLASDSHLAPRITPLIEKKGIENEYVNRYYLDDDLIQMRSRTVVDQFDDAVEINRDFKPYMFVKQSGHWLSLFKTSYRLLMILPVLFFLFLFVKQNPLTVGLYTGGFTGSSLEVTMMLAYQIFVGSIYLASAFFFAAFMGGLAAGSYLRYEVPKAKQVKSYYLLQFILAGFALFLPISISLIDSISGWVPLVRLIFFLLVFALAYGIGFEFNLASKLQNKSFSETSGVNYSTDLAGSAFGAFLTALFILPVLGLTYTCLVVAVLNILSGMIAFSARNKPIFL